MSENVEHEMARLAEEAGDLLIKNKKTVAVAESVTSGNIQAALSLASDASSFFQGGITAYNIGQKCRHLLVEPTHALESNCVSRIVSGQMCMEASRLFLADFGIAITGYASPVPDLEVEKLFAFVSIGKGHKILASRKINPGPLKGRDAQLSYTLQSLKMFVATLKM